MTVMQIILLILITTFGNMCCFILGAKLFQQITKGEKVGIDIPNPIKAIQEIGESFEEQKEQEKYRTIMDNIDNYNGTALGQKEIPNR